MNLYNSIEETRDGNTKKFNDLKDQILIIQKTLEDESSKKEGAHNEFMEFLKKMEEKIFLARVAEQAERFDDMVKFLEEAINLKAGEDFTVDERNLLSVGFKNLIGS